MVLAAGNRMGRVAIVRGAVDLPYSLLDVSLVECCRSSRNPYLGVGSHTLQICEHSVSRDRAVGDYFEMACVYRDRSRFPDKEQLSACHRFCFVAADYSGPYVANAQDKDRSNTNRIYEKTWL